MEPVSTKLQNEPNNNLLRPAQYLIHGYIRETEHYITLSSDTPDQVANVIISFYELPLNRPIIIDTGSSTIRAGFGPKIEPDEEVDEESDEDPDDESSDEDEGDESPRAIFPSKINDNTYPIKNGVVTDWDTIQKLWHRTINRELLVSSKGASVLITDSPVNTKENREKMTEIMFEKFNVDRFFILMDAVASLYACGRTTGLSISSGYEQTHVVPIVEEYFLGSSASLYQCNYPVLTMNIGGRHVTDYLYKLLTEKNNINHDLSMEIAEDIKKKCCYIAAQDLEDEVTKFNGKKYKLPDGTYLELGQEIFTAPEILFNPALIGSKDDGLAQIVDTSIKGCDNSGMSRAWNNLYRNMIFSGGNTLFVGLTERFHKELRKLAPPAFYLKPIAIPDRKHSAWIGARVLASLSTMEDLWITKKKYEEKGPSIVHQKCV